MARFSRVFLVALAAGTCLLSGCTEPRKGLQAQPANAVVEAKIAVLQTVGHEDPVVRARALEGVALFMAEDHGNLLVAAMDDESPGVRASAATAIGDIQYAPAKPRLLEMVSSDRQVGEPFLIVIPSVVYALSELGDQRHLKMLGPMLFSPVEAVRINTAEALGRIGRDSALRALKAARWKEQELGNQLRYDEAMARLGDQASAAKLEAYTKGRFMDLRIAGIIALSEHAPGRAMTVLQKILADEKEHPAIRLTAGGMLAKLGMSSRQCYLFTAAGLEKPKLLLEKASQAAGDIRQTADATLLIQRQAAWALGFMKRYPEGVDVLLPFVEHSDPSLKLLAAMSILRLLPDHAPQVPVQAQPQTPSNGMEVVEPEDVDPADPTEPLGPELPETPRPRLESSGAKD
ncbi:MAG: HEAT repeat domain-containing protein [Phycisphaerae bacterium]